MGRFRSIVPHYLVEESERAENRHERRCETGKAPRGTGEGGERGKGQSVRRSGLWQDGKLVPS